MFALKFFDLYYFVFGLAWLIKTAEFLLGGEEIETKDEKEIDKENDDGSGEIGKSVGLSVPKPLSSDSTFLLFKDSSSKMG